MEKLNLYIVVDEGVGLLNSEVKVGYSVQELRLQLLFGVEDDCSLAFNFKGGLDAPVLKLRNSYHSNLIYL